MSRLTEDELLTLEMNFTSEGESCRSVYSIDQYCRRRYKHEGDHASGFGAGRRVWERDPSLDALTDLSRYGSL